jgi:hypothetical protein
MTDFSWFFAGQAAARREDAWKKHPFRSQFSFDTIKFIQKQYDTLWINVYRASVLSPTHSRYVKITPEDAVAKLHEIDSIIQDRIQDVVDENKREAVNLQLEMTAKSKKFEMDMNDLLQKMKADDDDDDDDNGTTAKKMKTCNETTTTTTTATATTTTTATTTATATASDDKDDDDNNDNENKEKKREKKEKL